MTIKKKTKRHILSLYRSLLFIFILLVIFFIPVLFSKYFQTINADVNETINFQGKLANLDGTNFSGTCGASCDFEFSIYDASSGGTLLWSESQNNVGLYDGIFNVKLGSSTAFAGYLDSAHLDNFNKSPLYLEIKVDADDSGGFDANETFVTRLLLSAVPYAFNSRYLGGLDKNGFLQLAPASAQVDSSTASAIFINKTGSFGNLLQLQQAGNDMFVVGNDGTATVGGGLVFTNATPTIQINDASTLAYTDGTNTLFSIKDQGTYAFLSIGGKALTGNPATCSVGDIYFNTADSAFFGCTTANTWKRLDNSAGGSSGLSDITAATGPNSINNGDYSQTWNWSLTTADNIGLSLGENVASTATGNSTILSVSALTSSTATALYLKNYGNGYSFKVDDESGDATPFVITANGNVGIGVSNPTYPLEVWGNNASIVTRYMDSFTVSNPQSALQIGLDGGTMQPGGGPSYLFFADDSAGNKEFLGRLSAIWMDPTDGSEAGGLVLNVRSGPSDVNAQTEAVRIENNGNVGIGTNNPNNKLEVTQSVSTASENGLQINYTQTSNAVNLTASAFNISATSSGDAGDSIYGVNINNLTSSASTEYALNFGTGWDRDLNFNNTSTTWGFADATALAWTDGINNLLFAKDLSTNFGMALDAGAFMDRNSYVGEEFSKERADLNTDGALTWGDSLELGVDENTNCVFSIVDDVVNGIGRISTNAGGGHSCLTYHSSTAAGNAHLIFNSTNLPVILMKARPSASSATDDTWVGISDAVAGSTNEPNNGIYFTNNNTNGWYGVTRSASTSNYINCSTTISLTQFALLKIEVISTSNVKFYVDADTSNGISWTYCGASTTNIPTGNLTSLMMVSSTANNTYLDVDFYRVWQDDSLATANFGLEIENGTIASEVDITSADVLGDQATQESIDLAVLQSEIDERFKNLEKINSMAVGQTDGYPLDEYTTLLNLINIDNNKFKVNFDLDVVGDLIATGGLEVEGDANFAGQVIFNKDTVGQVRILAGATEASVKFEKEYRYQPVVNISVEGNSNISKYYVDKVTTEGFKVKIEPVQENDVTINWHAFGSKDGYITLSDGTKKKIKVIRVLKGMDQVFVDPLLSSECDEYVYERGFSNDHNGVDLSLGAGCPINSIGIGQVYFVGWENESGYTVKVDHGNGVKSYYYHGNGNFYIEVGDYVASGEKIMDMGSSGNSTGTHLHLGLTVNGDFIDPANYVPYTRDDIILQINSPGTTTTNDETTIDQLPTINNQPPAIGTLTILHTELDFLRIREQSNSDSLELGQIPVGAVTEYYSEEFGWYRINYNGIEGWVSGMYVEIGD